MSTDKPYIYKGSFYVINFTQSDDKLYIMPINKNKKGTWRVLEILSFKGMRVAKPKIRNGSINGHVEISEKDIPEKILNAFKAKADLLGV